MNCPHCHETINDNAKKCTWCMNYIDGNTGSSNTHPNLEGYRMKRFWAQIIDSLLSLLIIPIFINIYYYCRYGYTLGKKIMKIRVVNQSDNSIPTFKSLLYRHHYKGGWFLSIFYITLLSILIIVCVYLFSGINNLELYRKSFESSENYSIIEGFILLILFLPVIIGQLIGIIVPFHLLFKSNGIGLHDKLSQTKITQFDNPRINNNQRGRGEYMKMLGLILTPFLGFATIGIYSTYIGTKGGDANKDIYQNNGGNLKIINNALTLDEYIFNGYRHDINLGSVYKFNEDGAIDLYYDGVLAEKGGKSWRVDYDGNFLIISGGDEDVVSLNANKKMKIGQVGMSGYSRFRKDMP